MTVRLRQQGPFVSLGFTLIELLVALVVLSLVFLLLFSALQFGTKVWSSTEEQAVNTEQVLVVQGLLRRMLSESRPVVVESQGSTAAHLLFIGTKTSIRFVAPMPTHLGTGGFYEIVLQIDKGDQSGSRLVMAWKLFRQPSVSPNQLEKQRVLMEGITDLEFCIFRTPRPTGRAMVQRLARCTFFARSHPSTSRARHGDVARPHSFADGSIGGGNSSRGTVLNTTGIPVAFVELDSRA